MIIFSLERSPRALRLAAWADELMASKRPLLKRCCRQKTIPSPCASIVCTTFARGPGESVTPLGARAAEIRLGIQQGRLLVESA